LGGGNMLITVTGLNVALTPGTNHWIIGFQNNMADPIDVTSRDSGGPGDGTFWQQDNDHLHQFVLTGDTAFSVQGTGVPEPSTLLMMGTGLLCGIGALRRGRM
jgi:hypothetical protein